MVDSLVDLKIKLTFGRSITYRHIHFRQHFPPKPVYVMAPFAYGIPLVCHQTPVFFSLQGLGK
jgi:hypothetical protein